MRNGKANSVALELTVVRQLCLHRRRRDPHGSVPEQAWAPKTELPFLPHIFSRQEVRQLLIAAGRFQHRNVGPVLMRMLLLILYCTGLRSPIRTFRASVSKNTPPTRLSPYSRPRIAKRCRCISSQPKATCSTS
jgi:hypothetical protein